MQRSTLLIESRNVARSTPIQDKYLPIKRIGFAYRQGTSRPIRTVDILIGGLRIERSRCSNDSSAPVRTKSVIVADVFPLKYRANVAD